MKMVYLVWDCNNGEIVSAHKTEDSARNAVCDYLTGKCGYSASEWEEIAHSYGTTVDDFEQRIRLTAEFDDDLDMEVVEMELKD